MNIGLRGTSRWAQRRPQRTSQCGLSRGLLRPVGFSLAHRGERRIRLQEQPFQILFMLLEHPGAGLYEMAWSQQAFAGATSVEIREAILSREVSPPQRLNPAIHPRLQTIIEKALEKDRAVRYQHASDLRADLKRLQRQIQSDRPAGVTTSPQGGSSYPQAQGSARRVLFEENVRGQIKYRA